MKIVVMLIASGLVWAGAAWAGEHPTAGAPAAEETAKSAGLLDGKTFAGELGAKGDPSGDKDEFVFQQGKFVSTACIAYGFNEAPYAAAEEGGDISFTAEPTNAESETMSWRGIVRNDEIEGAAVHRAEGKQTEYWFRWTLKSGADHPKAEHPQAPKKVEHPAPAKKAEHPEHPR